jgi:hypothetical protein
VGVVDCLGSGHVFLLDRQIRQDSSAYRDMQAAGSRQLAR